MELFWYLPAGGSDGRYLGTEHGKRVANFDYMTQIARAVDQLGFTGALLPTGRFCEDAWLLASSLAALTERMKFLVAFRPGLIAPTLAARMAATFDYLSKGRLLINIVTGGSDQDAAADGLRLSKDERYALTDEFLTIWRHITDGETFSYEGKYLHVDHGHLVFPKPVQKPHPPLFFGGASAAGQRVAAKHADVYLTWAEPPKQTAEQIARVRHLAANEGRTVQFGTRLHIVVRETEREAWDAASDLLRYVTDETIAAAQQSFSTNIQAEGQRRMQQLHKGSREALEISPNLWAGIGLVRTGAGTALVGDPQTIAARIQEYVDLGVEKFIFSGYPHLEEAYRTAELLFPHLPNLQLSAKPRADASNAPSDGLRDFEFGTSNHPSPNG